eukprot:9469688-Pyramimonas_sp.AAC.1
MDPGTLPAEGHQPFDRRSWRLKSQQECYRQRPTRSKSKRGQLWLYPGRATVSRNKFSGEPVRRMVWGSSAKPDLRNISNVL